MSLERNEIRVGRGGDLVRCSRMIDAINAVCLLTLDPKYGSETDCRRATGSLVQCQIDEKDVIVILTNNHVVNKNEIADKFIATFNFDGRGESIKTIHLCPNIFFKTSNCKELDYTMIGIKKDDIDYLGTHLNIHPLHLKPVVIADLYKVNIIQIAQHPGGKQKRFSVGRVCEIQKTWILYDADTDAGSSGSPVFFAQNEDYKVLALHKSGGATATSCKELVNKGIFINIILNHVNDDPVELLEMRLDQLQCLRSEDALTTPELTRIGQRIPTNWEQVASVTGGFKKHELDNIRYDNHYHEPALKAIQMLSCYKKRRGSREKLAKALKEFGEVDLAEKVLYRYFQFHAD